MGREVGIYTVWVIAKGSSAKRFSPTNEVVEAKDRAKALGILISISRYPSYQS